MSSFHFIPSWLEHADCIQTIMSAAVYVGIKTPLDGHIPTIPCDRDYLRTADLAESFFDNLPNTRLCDFSVFSL